jgi:hypothetical protein
MNKEKKFQGALYADWDLFTAEQRERIYYMNHPNAAYREIVRLRAALEMSDLIANNYERIASAAVGAWKRAPQAVKRSLRDTDREKGVLESKRRKARFDTEIKAFLAGMPSDAKPPEIAKKIKQKIDMDTDLVNQAKERGESWQSLKLNFRRSTLKGAPYSEATVLDKVREFWD